MAGTGKSSATPLASPWEWAFAVISAIVVLGAIGALLYEAFAEPATPPRIEIMVDTILDTGTGYTVQFRAHNRGNTTAAGLVVEGELTSDTGSVETSSVTIPYVPPRAMREAGLIFAHDPRQFTLELQAKGYDLP